MIGKIINERPLDIKKSWGGSKVYKFECLDDEAGSVCTQLFMFRPRSYIEIEEMLGVEVPKILKGWLCSGHYGDGNSILDSTDKVSRVGTPFESREYIQNDRYHTGDNPRMDFCFVMAFSKRTLNKMLKQAGYKDIPRQSSDSE